MRTKVLTHDEHEVLIQCVVNRITPKAYVTKNLDDERIYVSKQYATIVDQNHEEGTTEMMIPFWLAEKLEVL